MAGNRRKLQAGLAAVVAFSLFVCMVTGGASARSPGGQIESTPHVTDVGATPIPGAAPVPTLGPGRFFDEEDAALPEISREAGDSAFGYGRVQGRDDLYAIWVTDDNGATHYLLVDSESTAIWGDVDPVTGQRRENGLDSLLAERQNLLDEIARQVAVRDSRQSTSEGLFGLGVLGLGAGAVCLALTLGQCGWIIAIGAPFVVGAFTVQGSADEVNAQIEVLASQLHDVEARIVDRYSYATSLAPLQ